MITQFKMRKIHLSFSLVCFLMLSLLVLEIKAVKKPKNTTIETIGSFGYRCIDECETRSYSYHWCNAEHPNPKYKDPRLKYWDYCSPRDDFDYKGNKCRHDHACGRHGEYNYRWCHLEEGSWGYCSYIRTITHE